MIKKVLIGCSIVLILALLTGCFYYFTIYKQNKGLLNELDKIIKEVETNVEKELGADESISNEVSSDVTEDEDTLDELESELDIALSKLEEIESAESALSAEVE